MNKEEIQKLRLLQSFATPGEIVQDYTPPAPHGSKVYRECLCVGYPIKRIFQRPSVDCPNSKLNERVK